jgi:hypothetical protein
VVRQAHHERNQQLAVRPEPVEGLVRGFLEVASSRASISWSLKYMPESLAASRAPIALNKNAIGW